LRILTEGASAYTLYEGWDESFAAVENDFEYLDDYDETDFDWGRHSITPLLISFCLT
jgi:hypothetical protein